MKPFPAPPRGACVHHSKGPDNKVLSSYGGIKHHHVVVNGWEDVGYHFIIEFVNGKARWYSARSTYYQGAHCRAVNATHLGICVVGDFDEQAPPQEVFDCLVDLLRFLEATLPGFSTRNTVFHSSYDPKTCPGRQFPRTALALALAGEERPQGAA